VLDSSTDDVIGCVYIDPNDTGAAEAMCRCWVRATHASLDDELFRALEEWLNGPLWSFDSVRFPGRPPATS
jgi:hypothetical protein